MKVMKVTEIMKDTEAIKIETQASKTAVKEANLSKRFTIATAGYPFT
jgi:hypothetical protein